ncbi:MAG TPA: SpoIID/LytB domain-containing protein [Clostridiaceae bacterium]|nr:SpoIID/LytB domain-containing protein [Clostridiaceae bacterium]
MKKHFTKIFVCLALIISALFCNTTAYAQYSIPNYIRIGLYYGDNGVSSFNVSAGKGLIFGEYTVSDFKVLLEDKTSSTYNIRKDSYFYETNGTLKECSPNSLPDGKVYGPYHVFIGGPFGELESIITSIMVYRQKGIDAYPVYTGSWEIWAGFYKSSEEAQGGITLVEDILGLGAYKVVEPSSSRIVISTGGQVMFVYSSGSGALQIRPQSENNPYKLTLNNSNYRGYLEVRRFWDSDMTVINILPFEEYLYGVVPIEMGYNSPIEALKAQAVAARTYAAATLGKYSKWYFDLCNSMNTQVYKGYDSEKPSTNQAVDETRGKVLTYNGQLINAFYFSTSGGKTEDYINVWGNYEIPYLKSVDDSYEPESAQYRNWEVTLTLAQIKQYVGSDIGDITNVAATRYSDSGRVIELVVTGTKGRKVYKKDECRTIFGLRSQMYTISSDGQKVYITGVVYSPEINTLDNKYIVTSTGTGLLSGSSISIIGADGKIVSISNTSQSYKFIGHGWGHGLGMSQEGAKGMANAGFNFQEILQYYYTGAVVQ